MVILRRTAATVVFQEQGGRYWPTCIRINLAHEAAVRVDEGLCPDFKASVWCKGSTHDFFPALCTLRHDVASPTFFASLCCSQCSQFGKEDAR